MVKNPLIQLRRIKFTSLSDCRDDMIEWGSTANPVWSVSISGAIRANEFGTGWLVGLQAAEGRREIGFDIEIAN